MDGPFIELPRPLTFSNCRLFAAVVVVVDGGDNGIRQLKLDDSLPVPALRGTDNAKCN